MFTRRATLLSAAGLAILVSGCKTGSVTPAQVSSDISSVANGLKNALPAMAATSGMNTVMMAKIAQAVADVQAVAAGFSTTDTQAAQQSLVTRIMADMQSVTTTLSGLSLSKTASDILNAINILLPVIETAVGMMVAGATTNSLEVEHARMVLRNS